jgi:MFS family permease
LDAIDQPDHDEFMSVDTRPVPAAAAPSRHHAASFWAIGAVFATAMAFSTVPTPLYAFYRAQDGFSTFMVTVVFAAYAVGVIGSLFLAGHVSDWYGRRPLLLGALTVEAVAAGLFLTWTSLAGLIVARVVTGVGVGLVTATATAALGELHAVARPGAGRMRADRVAVAANLGGLALGPLIAGALAQWVAAPVTVPYVLFLGLLAASFGAVLLAPETVALETRPRYRPQRVTVPRSARALYFTVAAAAFVAFAIFGLFTSVSASFLAGELHRTSPLLAGAVTFGVFAAGALAQILTAGLAPPRLVNRGLAVMSAGALAVTVAVTVTSLTGFVGGGLVAGFGVGMLFKGALATVVSITPADSRGEALAGLFLAAYAGLVVPVLGIGAATLEVSLATALTGFAIAVLVVSGAVALRLRGASASR